MSAVAALPVAWLVARAAGLVAFGLLTLSTWLGLAMSTRLLGPVPEEAPRLAPDARLDGPRVVGLHGERCFSIRPCTSARAVLVPVTAPWRPVAVAAGVVAAWLMLTLAISFRFRRWIGQRYWRLLHYASFAAFALALCHAITTGTDIAGVGGPILALVAGGPVLWLILRPCSPRGRRPPVARLDPDDVHRTHRRSKGAHHDLPHHHRPPRSAAASAVRRHRPRDLRGRRRRARRRP